MRRYSKEFKEEALKLSDKIGAKKNTRTARYPVLYNILPEKKP